MSDVLMTGFPGFLGSALLPRILARRPEARVLCLVQEKWFQQAEARLLELADSDPDVDLIDRVQLVEGDITRPGLDLGPGVGADVTEVFHLAAVYDLSVPEAVAQRVNVEGTAEVLAFCRSQPDFHRLQYVSTCYVSGNYPGTFPENELDLGQTLQNFYESTKFEAESLVRAAIAEGLPASIYRPGIVVGDSTTGRTQKYDGPYFVAHLLKIQPRVALVPRVADPDKVIFSMVPRDFVVDGIDALSVADVASGKTYVLTDPNAPTVREMVETFASLLDRKPLWVRLPLGLTTAALEVPGMERLLGIPAESLDYFAFPTRYSTTNATTDLAALGITCPAFSAYAPNLIRYYLQHPEVSASAMT